MIPDRRSVILCLVIPWALLLVGTLVLGPTGMTVAGVPAVYLWIFAMFPVTAALMWLSWQLWDRHQDYDGESAPDAHPASHAGRNAEEAR